MYILEISYKDSTIELLESSHWEKVYAYILQNEKDIMATLRLLPNSKLFVVQLGSESAAWEVELE